MKSCILTAILLAATAVSANSDQLPLKLVIEVSRHGAREPSENFPFAKNPSDNFQTESNLTWFGKKQQFQVGEYLKASYADLLPLEYSPADIKIRSTFKNRTYLSALYQIMGMYKEAVPSLTDRAQ